MLNNTVGYTERTITLKEKNGEYCWLDAETGEGHSPVFQNREAAQDWMKNETKGRCICRVLLHDSTEK